MAAGASSDALTISKLRSNKIGSNGTVRQESIVSAKLWPRERLAANAERLRIAHLAMLGLSPQPSFKYTDR